jgi:hypothetical protein
MFLINFDSTYRLDDGYGNSGEQILLAMDRHPEIRVFSSKHWSNFKNNGLNDRTLSIVRRGFNPNSRYSIRYSQPDSFSSAPACKRKKIGWSMWEFTNIPKAWEYGINSVDVRFVPCTHNQKVWKNQGANIPTYVVPLGIDPNIFYPRESESDIFTFLLSGTLNGRKNPSLVYESFKNVFGDRNDVQLIIKSIGRLPVNFPSTDNIQIINEMYTPDQYAELLSKADCFVYPTQGEGFGLGPLEAMACGTTTICTNWSGPEDYLDDEYAYKLKYSLTGSVGSHWGDTFNYAVPDKEHLKYLMLYTFNNRDEVALKGKIASKTIRDNFTWENTANRLYSIFQELG